MSPLQTLNTLWFEQALLPHGWARHVRLSMDHHHIAKIETDQSPNATDERHLIGLGGMPNVHSHAFQRCIAGLTERKGVDTGDSFWTWRETMFAHQAKIGPDEMQAIAALAYMQMLESGFTRVGEFHYLHHDQSGLAYADVGEMSSRLIEAARTCGIGMTLLPVFYAHSGFGGKRPLAQQARFIHDLDGFERLLSRCGALLKGFDDAKLGIAPHSLRAVTSEQLRALTKMLPSAPLHIHIAEQEAEVEACIAINGARPVEYLMSQFDVDQRWCLVHATHMTASEVGQVARSKAVVGLCPITEANLGDGIFSGADFINQGGRYGIGSDSNVLIDVAQELRMLEYSQRLNQQARNVMATHDIRSTGQSLYQAALIGGAQALSFGAGLCVGAPADIVSLKGEDLALLGLKESQILDAFVFASAHNLIDCVWRYGRKQVQNGVHIKRDEIVKSYQAAILRMRA